MFKDFGNKQVASLPSHLRKYVVNQNYEDYTSIDHAVWRYVMRKNIDFLSKVADQSYLDGLSKTGISLDKIPNIQKMNDMLGKINWGAVCVDGFIPPSSFMEFQAYNVLVIAADIRQLEHIEYTPAPDIIHEAAGHAPIIADKEYAEYLRFFGEIGSKAISSSRDYDLYEAIRYLSIIKEDPNTKEIEIELAKKKIDDIQLNMGEPSEMALIRNLHWWTVEYGLIGDLENPKIYGAGLLSSIGESEACLKSNVKKIPYELDAVNVNFDITEMQPQLFVTPNYKHLTNVLENFANTMSLRKGGLYGLNKAIESKNVATAVFSSGLQLSGIFNNVIVNDSNLPIYISTSSPSTLSFEDIQLLNHGKKYHKDGFSSPLGRLKGSKKNIENMTLKDLKDKNIFVGERSILEFESGVIVDGVLTNIEQNKFGLNMVFTFLDCKVTLKDDVLFNPSWGVYDMAIGEKITSVFSGPADIPAFDNEPYIPKSKTHKINYSKSRIRLHELYQCVRNSRENNEFNKLKSVWNEIKLDFKNDWLCALEILEIINDEKIKSEIKSFLFDLSNSKKEYKKLINDGIVLL